MNSILILFVVFLIQIVYTNTQSTCPVIYNSLNELGHPQQQQQHQRCKCGIKTDGQIYIYCARKQLKRLPKFTRSSILYEELILSGNQIERISANSFSGIRVKRLYLDDNPLSFIEPNALNELANYLEELVISVSSSNNANDIAKANLPLSIFQNLLNLKIIKLSGLLFGSNLKQSTFNRTRKLEILHLVDSGLQRVEINSLSGLEYTLKELNLDNNHLTSTLDIFSEIKRMKRLQTLVLSRNKIRKLARFALSSSNENSISVSENELNEFSLDLSFNAINQIDEYAFDSSLYNQQQQRSLAYLITKLNLNNNELNQFQLSFISQLINLRELSLDYNKIESIPENLFLNSRGLETLSLKGNSIISIQSEFSFSGLHFNLKRLNLASNKMQSLGKRVFMQTTKLRELNLERNNLGVHFDSFSNTSELMSTFEGVESELKQLNLENNQLKPVHLWSLVNLLNMESLKIGHNKFSSLNLRATLGLEGRLDSDKLFKLFELYRNLSYLDMQNSSLSQIPYFVSLNRSLVTLNLAQNQICNVNANNLRFVYSRLKNLNLNSNPLKCDCNLISLREWLDMTEQQADATINWKCHTPQINRNKIFTQLNSNYDFSCDSSGEDDTCALDLDETMFKKATSTATTTTMSTSTMTTTSQSSSILPIIIFGTTSQSLTKIVSSLDDLEVNETKQISKIDSVLVSQLNSASNPIEQSKQTSTVGSFFNSMELKQTMLGSFIGALSVILIVFIIIAIIKLKNTKHCGKDISICNTTNTTNESDKDKSNRTTTTNGSPYDLTKLSLCINNCGNSSSSSSSSGSSASSCTSSLGVANSSCICGILKSAGLEMNHDNKDCLFNKMDPLRLTMLSSASNLINTNNPNNSNNINNNMIPNRSSFYQHYLNNQLPYNCNNIHYIASHHLPYSSPAESLISGSCPSPYQLTEQPNENDKSQENKLFSFLSGKVYSNSSNSNLISNTLNATVETNTYDKLHHRLNNSLSFVKPSNTSFNTLSYSGNSTNQCLHPFNLNELICNNRNILNAETTPFLILSNNEVNRFIDLNTISENPKPTTLVINNNYDLASASQASNNETYQHTYHEIGDVLINNGKSVHQKTEKNGNEMFI